MLATAMLLRGYRAEAAALNAEMRLDRTRLMGWSRSSVPARLVVSDVSRGARARRAISVRPPRLAILPAKAVECSFDGVDGMGVGTEIDDERIGFRLYEPHKQSIGRRRPQI